MCKKFVILHRVQVLLLNIGCIGPRNFIVKRRHKNVRMTSVLIKIADVIIGYLKVKMDLLKRWHPKVCKKKNPTCVCGYVRQFCPLGEPLGSQRELIVYPSSRRPSVARRPSVVHHFQRSPLKLLGQSNPNFMWSLLGKGERKLI